MVMTGSDKGTVHTSTWSSPPCRMHCSLACGDNAHSMGHNTFLHALLTQFILIGNDNYKDGSYTAERGQDRGKQTLSHSILVEVRVTDSTTASETHGGVQDGSQSVVTAVEWGTDGPNTTHKHNRT